MIIVAVGVLGFAVWLRRRAGGRTARSVALLAVALVSVGILPQALQRPDSAHLMWVTCVSFPFSAVAVTEAVRRWRPHIDARAAVAAGGAAAIALTFVFTGMFTFRYYLLHTRVGLGQVPSAFAVQRGDRNFYLGDLRVEVGSGEVVLAAAKERSLLAALALNPGRVVSGRRPGRRAVGRRPSGQRPQDPPDLRVQRPSPLGSEVVATEASGYVLRIAPDEVDVGRFRALVRGGEDALRRGSIDRARELLGEAVALWRGDPFAGVGPHTGLAAEAVRLGEEYLTALETRITADLAAGCDGELVGELEALVREHPFRERLWGHLMVALYRSGRQADALAAYRRARTLLRDELGPRTGRRAPPPRACRPRPGSSRSSRPGTVAGGGQDRPRSPDRRSATRCAATACTSPTGSSATDRST